VIIGSSSNGAYHRDHAKRTHFHGEVGETWGSEARRPSWQETWSRVDILAVESHSLVFEFRTHLLVWFVPRREP